MNAVRGVVEKAPGDPGAQGDRGGPRGATRRWLTVRPPLVELAPERREPLLAELRARGFAMPGLRGA